MHLFLGFLTGYWQKRTLLNWRDGSYLEEEDIRSVCDMPGELVSGEVFVIDPHQF